VFDEDGCKMNFDVFSLFPEVMQPYLESSVLGKAQERSLIQIRLHNIRDFTTDKHHITDDEPFGGGGGMVMKVEPVFNALEGVLGERRNEAHVILLTPQGEQFTQAMAHQLSDKTWLALICGRYEGIDERIRTHLVDQEISIGDFVLTGGELAALTLIDATIRLLPGVLGDSDAIKNDSHSSGLLEYPHYTRPANFRGWEVPPVLRSGDHGRIEVWRHEQALRRTFRRRPDLLVNAELDQQDLELLSQWKAEESKPD
jgi:tRNA (guanine37-N1)-methyltransferase